MEELLERAEDVNASALALIHLKLGDNDRAFEWLEKAFKAHTTDFTPSIAKLMPFFDEITSDPRFDELLKNFVRSFGGT